MGKYKQWLHHQEVGRRLREQIATHEQERERVQRMAPSHPTTLPDTNNPLVRALLDYTGRGGTLGRAVGARTVGANAGGGDAEPHQRQPARLTGAAATPAAPVAPAGVATPAQAGAVPAVTPSDTRDNPVVAQLTAQAAQMPANPLDAMRALAQSQARDAQPTPPAPAEAQPAPPSPPPAPEADTAGEWWQRFRSQS
jgi:hypothetical protein